MSSDCVVASTASFTGSVTGEFTPTGLRNGGRLTEVTLNALTWTALPPTALTDRNGISIQNQSNIEIKLHYDNTTVGYVGVKVAADSERFYEIKDTIVIYGKASSGTPTILIEELS